MIVGLLRHGRTAWNDAGRMQGRADVHLSDAGRAQVRQWRLPASLIGARLVASPLARARETAALLGAQAFDVDDALIEMDWGEWEGETIEALKTRHGAAFAANSARGLDFRPPGGESPRDVQRRFVTWLRRNTADAPALAVTHQGVIRSVLALATGWDMTGKPPVRLADDIVHLIEVNERGTVRPHAWNVALIAGPIQRRRPG